MPSIPVPPTTPNRSTWRRLALGVTFAFALVSLACSSDGDDATSNGSVDSTADQPAGDGTPVDEETPVDEGTPATGGSASLTVDGQTWEFDSLVCGFGEELTGVEGAELNLSARSGSISLYVAVEPDGDHIEVTDLADDTALSYMTTGEPTIEVQGKSVRSTADFMDLNGDTGAALAGSLEATCP